MDHLADLKSFIGKEFITSPSPFMLWLRPIVRAVESGSLTFEYTIRPEWANPVGRLHGGITAAIIDDVIGATMFSFNEPFFYTTINNVIDYFAPAKIGDIILAETSIIKKGKQIVNAQCEVWNETHSRLIARGTSNMMRVEFKKEQ